MLMILLVGLIADGAIPGGTRWWTYLYATMVLALCLVVCLIGGAMFARTSIFILCVSKKPPVILTSNLHFVSVLVILLSFCVFLHVLSIS